MNAASTPCHLHLETLEGRLQPGSMFSGVLDPSALVGSLGLLGRGTPVVLHRLAGAIQEPQAGGALSQSPVPSVPAEDSLISLAVAEDHQPRDISPAPVPMIPNIVPQSIPRAVPLDLSDAGAVAAQPLNRNQPPDRDFLHEGLINGDFETGDFTGWHIHGDRRAAWVGDSPMPPSGGQYAAEFGRGSGFAPEVIMDQDVLTGGNPTGMYDVAFSLFNGSSQNQITIKWGDRTIYRETHVAPHPYEYQFFLVPAHAHHTRLSFEIRVAGAGEAGVAIDDVVALPC